MNRLRQGLQWLVDRFLDVRVRVLANPRFQRWAARFPLTRPVARRRAAALFDLSAGFVYTQVLQACVRLHVIETLADGALTVDEVAARIGLERSATERLLAAASSLRLLERRPRGRYGVGIHGASYLGNPIVGRMVEHHALLYRDLEDPVALLRGERADTELSRFWSYASPRGPGGDEDVAAYSELMARSLALLAEDILEAYPFARHRRVLDVGGGQGAFLEAVARHAPHASLVLFDLPAVAARARTRLTEVGLSRVEVVGGDVFEDPLPRPADLVSLVRVLHDHDDDDALRILRAARAALAPDGVLLVAEPMSETRGAEPMGAAYFGFYLLAMSQGRPRSPAEIRDLLRRAGFDRVRGRRTRRPMLARLLLARPA
ncbi:MAG: methyltransferase [Sandaracinaceae bacterium]